MVAPVIDVHTHMLNEAYLRLLKKHGRHYTVKKVVGGQTGIHRDGAPFMTLTPGMFDYELRIKAMDEAGVDLADLPRPQREVGRRADEAEGDRDDGEQFHQRKAAAGHAVRQPAASASRMSRVFSGRYTMSNTA